MDWLLGRGDLSRDHEHPELAVHERADGLEQPQGHRRECSCLIRACRIVLDPLARHNLQRCLLDRQTERAGIEEDDMQPASKISATGPRMRPRDTEYRSAAVFTIRLA
jgi:hypothetical protein